MKPSGSPFVTISGCIPPGLHGKRGNQGEMQPEIVTNGDPEGFMDMPTYWVIVIFCVLVTRCLYSESNRFLRQSLLDFYQGDASMSDWMNAMPDYKKKKKKKKKKE